MTGARPQVVLATRNLGKVGEIAPLLSHLVELLPRPAHVPDVVEDAGTLEGNARLKAVALARATGLPALADDTGVFVDALPDHLGVEAAHFGGDHLPYDEKNRLLLDALRRVSAQARTARFETVALLRWPDRDGEPGPELVAVGAVTGRIAEEPAGDEGWGFDPVFAPDEGDGRTFAELGDAVKQQLSHRARAFRRMAWLLGDGTGAVLQPAETWPPETWLAEAWGQPDAPDGTIVGSCTLRPGDDDRLEVAPGWAERGVGARLLAVAAQRRPAVR